MTLEEAALLYNLKFGNWCRSATWMRGEQDFVRDLMVRTKVNSGRHITFDAMCKMIDKFAEVLGIDRSDYDP